MDECDANIMDMIDLITVHDICVNYVSQVRSLGNNFLLRWREGGRATIIE